MVTVRGNEARFRFFRPTASRVDLAGDFNAWRTGQLRMSRGADGTWEAALWLPKGTYEFAYFADGRWFVDYASFGLQIGPFGPNGLLRIAPGARDAG